MRKAMKGVSRGVQFLNSTVSEVTGRPKKEGFLFGIELEIEGQGVGMDGIPSKNWHRKAEGSLRGESIEYVFQSPCDYNTSVERVNNLFRTFKKHNVRLNNSYRTSTHVHMNFLDKPMKNVINFFILHTIFEEVLAAYCGETRLGNLFCISARDNEDLVNMLERAVQGGNLMEFGENIRYCAANIAALNQFGSIEIRTMRGADSAEEVVEWLTILNTLYEYACSKDCPAPWQLCEHLSMDGPEGFLQRVFGRVNSDKLLNKWPVIRDLRQSLYDGVRLIQMLAYGLEEDWSAEYKKEVVAEAADPFGRRNGGAPVLPPKIEAGPEGTDQLRLPNGGRWWINRRDHVPYYPERRIDTGDYLLSYDVDGDYWWDAGSGETLRWEVYNGNLIRNDSITDMHVNRTYRIETGIDDEEGEDL